MGSRAIYQSGPSIFKKLVRLVARTFYAGPCPPRAEGPVSRKKWDKVDTTGLAIIILDNLTQQEWVKEENLFLDMKIAKKLLTKALRYLQQERILRHESRKEGKRAQAKDAIVLATKKETTSQEKPEGDAPPKPLLQSYWAIDYPAFWDVLRLRLHLMRFKIKSEMEDFNAVMEYVCPQCDSRYSSLDFATLLNHQTGKMLCEECGTEVLEDFGNESGTGTVEDRRQRREDMKAMLKKMDSEMKVILDLVNQAKDIKPPDYGDLSDWAYERSLKKKTAGKAQDSQDRHDERDINFDVDLSTAGSELHTNDESKETAKKAKELPPWLMKPNHHRAVERSANANPQGLKRKLAEILPPPIDDIPPSNDAPVVPFDRPAANALSSLTIPLANGHIEKKSRTNLEPQASEGQNEDDGIEWEWMDAPMAVDSNEHNDGDDACFDTEAARVADIQSDLRTNTGWTTVQKRPRV